MFRSVYVSLVMNTFVVTLFLVSCSGGGDKTVNTEGKTLAPDSTALPVTSPEVKTLEGYMDTLYIDKKEFLARVPSQKKLVFKYYINSDGRLTLHAWQRLRIDDDDDDEYDPADFELKNGTPTSITFGKESFLGNVVIKPAEVGTIRSTAKHYSNMKYVVFIPKKDKDFPKHFLYDIILTDYEPNISGSKELTKSQVPVNVKANPSPPR